ncbi:MAG: hypothetical protein ABSB54_19365, partial [Acidimicrobiales bacterium]
MRLYVYKCRDDPATTFNAYGNWNDVFGRPGVAQWGGAWATENSMSRRIFEEELRTGDLILAYQTDLRAAVGVAEVVGFKQTSRGE